MPDETKDFGQDGNPGFCECDQPGGPCDFHEQLEQDLFEAQTERDKWKKAHGLAVTMMDREEVRAKKLDAALAQIALEAGVHGPLTLPTREIEARVVLAIQGLREQLPHPIDKGKTHWEGCHTEKGHHNCAVRYIREMSKSINAAQKTIRLVREELGIKPGEALLGISVREGPGLKRDVVHLSESLTIERKVNTPITAEEECTTPEVDEEER